jgi:hypothetical protein
VAAREANLGKPVTDDNNNNRLDTDFIAYPTQIDFGTAPGRINSAAACRAGCRHR